MSHKFVQERYSILFYYLPQIKVLSRCILVRLPWRRSRNVQSTTDSRELRPAGAA